MGWPVSIPTRFSHSHLLATPQYGIWIPPGVAHVALNRLAAGHTSLYVAPLIVALLDHLRAYPQMGPPDERRARLLLAGPSGLPATARVFSSLGASWLDATVKKKPRRLG